MITVPIERATPRNRKLAPLLLSIFGFDFHGGLCGLSSAPLRLSVTRSAVGEKRKANILWRYDDADGDEMITVNVVFVPPGGFTANGEWRLGG